MLNYYKYFKNLLIRYVAEVREMLQETAVNVRVTASYPLEVATRNLSGDKLNTNQLQRKIIY
jgi:hypothetical protein